MAFDQDKYKKLFEKRFGSGSYESGLSNARNIGRIKADAEFAKKDYALRLKEAKDRQKRLEEAEKKEQDKTLVYGDIPAKEAREMQKKAHEQGRGGYQPTYDNRVKEAKATRKAKEAKKQELFPDFSKITPYAREQYMLEQQEKAKEKEKKKKSDKNLIGGLLGKIKKSEIGKAAKAAEDFFNPFDNVKAKDAVKNYINSDKSKAFDEVARGANRAVDSAFLGGLSNLDKKVNDREPYYTSQRKFNEGGGTDMLTSGLGYLVPGLGAYKALNATKAGKALTQFGSQGLKQRLASEAAKGAITGGGMAGAEVGIREALNPDDYNAKQNLGLIGLGVAGGAIADPLLYGAGRGAMSGLSRFAKGDVPTFTGGPSQATIDKLAPNVPKTADDLMRSLRPNAEPKPFNTMNDLGLPARREVASAAEQVRGREFEPITQAPTGGKMVRLKPGQTPRGEAPPPAKIDNPKEIVKQQIDTSGKREKTKWSFDKFMAAWVDDTRAIEKATTDLGGKNLKAEENPYILARNARGAAGKAETFIKGGIYTKEGQKTGKALEEIVKPMEKNLDDFLAYVTSKRAIDYDEKGLTAGIKPKDVEGFTDRQLAEATIKQIEAENPAIKTHQQELVKYSQSLMKELKDSGYYTEDTIKQIFKENPNYVPMNRVQEPKVRGFEPLANPKNKFASLTNPIKARTGSQKPIVNPIESLVKNTYLITNIAERNKVGSSLLNLIENAPEGNMWGRVVKVSKQDNSVDGLTQALDEANAQLDNGTAEAVDNLFKGEGNKIYAYRDGQKIEMEVQEDLYKAMLSLDTQKQNFFIKMMSVPTKTLRTGAVLSPDFGPVNIFRDQFSAFINSKYGFIPFVDMFSGLGNVLKKDDVYWQWKTNGGANSVLSSLDREYLQKDIRKMVSRSLMENVKDRAKHPLDSILSPLRKVSEATEEATRLGEFKKGLKKGATPTEAAFASRDLIDFNRAGYLGRQYNQVTAFFNAAVQSIDKLARTFKENPVGATTKAFTGITLPSIVAYAYNHDKEWYKEIPQKERDLYWHFELDGQIFKLPKPFEAGIMFGTAAERTLAALKDNDPKAFDGFLKTVTTAFTPPWLPTAFTPWIEVFANKSTYFGSPIVPRREQDLLPEDQFGPYQSEVSKGLGAITKSSPRNIEHVFKGYTGGLGKYALQLSDMAAQAAGKERPELPDRGLGDIPIVNRFAVKNLEGNNQSVDDFYKHMDKLRRISQSAKKNDEPNPSEGTYKLFNKLSREISDLQAEKRAIIEDPNMDGKRKAEIIKVLDTKITQIAKKGNSAK